MKVSCETVRRLDITRETRDMTAAGYELVEDHGGPLWELRRGVRRGHKITSAVISADGLSVWVKIEETK